MAIEHDFTNKNVVFINSQTGCFQFHRFSESIVSFFVAQAAGAAAGAATLVHNFF
jgi:hypothetical protein